MFLKIALRNIWRNRTRTLITSGSIFFAVLFASFMNAFQKGGWERMMDNVINFYYGYVQVQGKGYWDDKSIDNAFALNEEILNKISAVENVTGYTPRLESFALASFGSQTNGMLVVGTDPEKENNQTALESKLIEGRYFKNTDQAVLIAEGVKKLLKIKLNDKITLISQGYHGVNAAGMYTVCGVVKFASPELNKRMIYLPLNEAQYFFDAQGLVTSLGLKLSSRDDLPKVSKSLINTLDTSRYVIMDWKSMLPELVEAQKTDAAGNYIFLLVLYALITFGIFGTIIMMTKERQYEFGVLISIGMKRRFLAFVVWMEILILGLIGSAAGILGSIPLVYYFHIYPIDFSDYNDQMGGAFEKWGFDPIFPTAFETDIFLYQALIVVILTSVLSTYAIYKIMKLKPMEAMRS